MGPKERRFFKRMTAAFLVFLSLFLLGLFLLPEPYRLYLQIPYPFALLFWMWIFNSKLRSIRESEQKDLA